MGLCGKFDLNLNMVFSGLLICIFLFGSEWLRLFRCEGVSEYFIGKIIRPLEIYSFSKLEYYKL